MPSGFLEVKDLTQITKELVLKIAELARLELSDKELENLQNDLGSIIHYVEKLNELDTTGVPPTSHVLDLKNVMREDIPVPGIPREEVLKNVPDHQDGQIRVPSILE